MLTLTEKLRAGYVRRCHIIPMAREQSLADHLYRVELITEELLKACGRYDLNSNFTLNTMRIAKIHDLHEVKLGDIPTNGKIRIRAAERELGCGGDALNVAAFGVDPDYQELDKCDIEHWDGLCHLFVKFADNLELLDHLGLMGMGARAAEVWVGAMEASFVVYDLLAKKAGLNPEQERRVMQILVDCCENAVVRGWNVKREETKV